MELATTKQQNQAMEEQVWKRDSSISLLGSLSNDDDDGNENVISKYNFSFL